MFKKIRTKRDPKATIWGEIDKEFSPYFFKGKSKTKSFIHAHPKLIFLIMVMLIVVSVILSFTVFSNYNDSLTAPVASTDPVVKVSQSPFSEMGSIVDMMEESFLLERSLDSIMRKESLSKEDSVVVLQALERLDILEKSLNIRQNEKD